MSASSTVRTGPVVRGLLARLRRDRQRAVSRPASAEASGEPARPGSQARETTRSLASRLNWLRAGVLGANDGIVSISGLLVGVAAVDPSNTAAIALAGASGIASASLSMSVGEYVSVSTQRDTEHQIVVRKQTDLERDPAGQERALAELWESRGLSPSTAQRVARELSERDALEAHLTTEYHIDPDDLTNPWAAAGSSFVSFLAGSALPFLTMLALAPAVRIPATFAAVLVALAATGWVSAWLGGAPRGRAVIRLLIGGAAAMAFTFGIGHLFGTSGLV
ncbi:MAG: VIT family protein [Actinomyces sp.]|jgi:VIT1/CCC1 family predicted Fe2+/Mn2+ transporter|nr:VIT family protein [Actinomyces sp.]MCI1661360.1 VIT family protein [Actinomyces sp.]